MGKAKVFVFGAQAAGKTVLINKLIDDQAMFEKKYVPTPNMTVLVSKNNELLNTQIWDGPGNKQTRLMHAENSKVGIYCVDLKVVINQQEIEQDIQSFRQKNPKCPIVLVGTKLDKISTEEEQEGVKERFLAMKIEGIDNERDKRLITSAKDGYGIAELREAVSSSVKPEIEAQPVINDEQPSSFEEAEHTFLAAIDNLSKGKKEALKQELTSLNKNIATNPELAIKNFTNNCHKTLQGKHPKVMQAVRSVAAAAAITALAGLIGFGIGFALGLWSGPGALITGLVAGATLAVGVGSGLCALGLFKEPKGLDAVNDFVKAITNETPFEPL